MWKAPKIWEKCPCWIIGGGASILRELEIPLDIIQRVTQQGFSPSLYAPYFQPIWEDHIIGTNDAYRLGPWVDFTFFGDCSWFLAHRKKLVAHPSIKITCGTRFGNRREAGNRAFNEVPVKYLGRDKERKQGISKNRSKVSWNNNSGAASISFARHLGATTIFLLGFDMVNTEIGGVELSHWHDGHKAKRSTNEKPAKKRRRGRRSKRAKEQQTRSREKIYARHLEGFDQIKIHAKELGIQIFNVNPKSKINQFKKISFKEALEIRG